MDTSNTSNGQAAEVPSSNIPPTDSPSGSGGNVAKSRWHTAALTISNTVQVDHQIPYFLFDPDSSLVFYWTAAVAISTLYNAWMVALRIAFPEVREQPVPSFLGYLDYVCDIIYLLDIVIHLRTAYLLDGIPVFDPSKIRQQYTCQVSFIRDVISILPTENIVAFLPESVGASKYFLCTAGAARLSRLIKFHSLYRFYDLAESRMSTPHFIRVFRLSLSLVIVIHWIACLYYLVSENEGLGSNEWVYTNDPDKQKFLRKYIVCLYWSAMTLTTIGNCNPPETDLEYVFTGVIFLTGVFVFATVLGNVGDVISSMNANRQEFQARMDNIKIYLTHKKVPASLQLKIKKWAEYTWSRTKATDESRLLNMLPERLRAEVAVHVHLDNLKKVKIFEQCEIGFLCELVLKLRSQVFSPGDFICKAGETGREMYIINHGKVEVLVTSPVTNKEMVVACLSEGNYFGEISLLRLDGVQNRRTADVRSIGYSELLTLSRRDLMSALVEYPEAKSILESQAKQRMKTNIQAQRAFSVDALLRNSQDSPDNGSLHREDLRGRDVMEIKAMIEELKSVSRLAPGKTIWQLMARCETLQAKISEKEREVQENKLRIFQLETMLRSRHYRRLHRREETSPYEVRDDRNGPCSRVTKQYSQEEGRYSLLDPISDDSGDMRDFIQPEGQNSHHKVGNSENLEVMKSGFRCRYKRALQDVASDAHLGGWESEDTIVEEESIEEEDDQDEVDLAEEKDNFDEIYSDLSVSDDAANDYTLMEGRQTEFKEITSEANVLTSHLEKVNDTLKQTPSKLESKTNRQISAVNEADLSPDNGFSSGMDRRPRTGICKQLSVVNYVVDIEPYSGNDEEFPSISTDPNFPEIPDVLARELNNDVQTLRHNSVYSNVSDDSSSRRNSAFWDSDCADRDSDTDNENSK